MSNGFDGDDRDDLTGIFGENHDPSATEYEERQFGPLKPDWYTMEIKSMEVRSTLAKNGKYVNVGLQVVDGPGKGKYVWDKFNIVNQSVGAQAIGREKLDKLGAAAGIPTLRACSEFIGKIVDARVKVQKGNPEENDFADFRAVGSQEYGTPEQATTPAPRTQPQQQQQPKTAPATNAMPWMRK